MANNNQQLDRVYIEYNPKHVNSMRLLMEILQVSHSLSHML